MAEFHVFSGADTLADYAAAKVASVLAQGVGARGAASLIVPGGRTPEEFLTKLGGCDLDWPRVSVTLCDERWVDEHSPDSNAAMIRRTLLIGAAATFVPLYNGAATPEGGLADTELKLSLLPTPWDAVVLGMGDDGHFASLFPGEPALAIGLDLSAKQRCVAAHGPAAGPKRLSLTLSCLAKARHIFLIVTGAHKRGVWQNAQSADPETLPVAALHRLTDVPVDFLWCP